LAINFIPKLDAREKEEKKRRARKKSRELFEGWQMNLIMKSHQKKRKKRKIFYRRKKKSLSGGKIHVILGQKEVFFPSALR
jgi:hypothetical protein